MGIIDSYPKHPLISTGLLENIEHLLCWLALAAEGPESPAA